MFISKTPILVFLCILKLYIFNFSSSNRLLDLHDLSETLNSYPHNVSNISELIHVDVKNRFNTDKISYEYNPLYKSHTFTPKLGYLISLVTNSGQVIWSSDDFGIQYVNKVFIGNNKYGERVVRIYYHEYRHNLASDSLHDPLPPESQAQDTSPKPYILDQPNLITIDVSHRHSTDKILYQLRGKSHEFNCIFPHLITKVTKKGIVVWDSENKKFANKAVVEFDEENKPTLKVYFPFVTTPHSLLSVTPSEQTDITPITLNIDFTWSTNLHFHTRYNGVFTFTPREGFAFNNVIKESGFLFFSRLVTIWHTNDPKLYSSRIQTSSDLKTVLIYLGDGSVKLFKLSLSNSWDEVDKISDFIDPLDSDYRLVDLDVNFAHSTHVYDYINYSRYDNFITDKNIYNAKNVFKFKSVREGNNIIWKAKEKTEYAFKVEYLRIRYREMGEMTIYMINGMKKVFIKKIPYLSFKGKWIEDITEPIDKTFPIKRQFAPLLAYS